eukprot:CAMPEP_0172589590 /NCGR_PEP_ID=MMETSP1068-20121228/8257_1 /TAXON_ID=35684 /ORGANISM="Pseudopedinella elastica, Strain CCMP716" /LENGTH=920 /DNA_ID=CAMNT_0013385211 /DNA_START=121 /DNA_END=2884 /DNA_ORIENTATION=+
MRRREPGTPPDPREHLDPMIALAVIPSSTCRDAATKRPFNVAKRRPAPRDLKPLGPEEESAATLEHLDKWATTFLREDAGCPPASWVYSVEARVRKWELLRHLHGVLYGSGSKYRYVSLEGALWSRADTDGFVGSDTFVSSLIGAYRFDRSMRMETRLRRLYKCFEGAESDRVDYREVSASLRVLEAYRELPRKSKTLMLHLYDLWADKDNEYDQHGHSSAKQIPTAHALRLMGLGAESDRDLKKTRARFLGCLAAAAPAHGLKPTTSLLPRALFVEVLERWPDVVEAWREVMWNRCTDEMRLAYLANEEATSQERCDYLDQKMKMKKAMERFEGSLTKRTFEAWVEFYTFYKELNNKRLYVMYKSSRRALLGWHEWAADHRRRVMLKRVATTMGKLNLQRYPFGRWKRYLANQRRVGFTTARFSPEYRLFSEGFSALRFAWRRGSLRLAISEWREETVFQANWEYARKYSVLLHKRVNFGAWRLHVKDRVAHYRREEEARANQKQMKKMMEDFAQMDADAEAAAIAEAERLEREAREGKLREKEMKIFWANQKKDADKQANDRFILWSQKDERDRRGREQRSALWKGFAAKWRIREDRAAEKARLKTREWIKDKAASRNAVERALTQLNKDFYSPPSVENQAREEARGSVGCLMMIHLMAMLFQMKQNGNEILMREWLLQFDHDQSGTIDAEEFLGICNSIDGLSLKADEVREIVQAMDANGDGVIVPSEFEKFAEQVERHCGVARSPWKIYIDKEQDMQCYHNIQTGEKVFDFEMTKKKLVEINEANLVAAAEHEARVDSWKLMNLDWEQTLKEYAARVLQRLYHSWHQNRLLDRLRFRMRKVMAAREFDHESFWASKIIAVYRGRNERRVIRPLVAKAYAKKMKKQGKDKGLVYYENTRTKEITRTALTCIAGTSLK